MPVNCIKIVVNVIICILLLYAVKYLLKFILKQYSNISNCFKCYNLNKLVKYTANHLHSNYLII